MFTTFDKAIAGGAAAWISSGIVALMTAVFHLQTPIDASINSTITMIVGAVIVYFWPNKTA